MKYLPYVVPLVLLTSCTVIQEDYYGPGYYNPPAHAHVEVHRYYPENPYHGDEVSVRREYHSVPRAYHRQEPINRNESEHGHGSMQNSVIRPQTSTSNPPTHHEVEHSNTQGSAHRHG